MLDDLTLLRFFENDLPDNEHSAVERALLHDPEARSRLEILKQTDKTLKDAFSELGRYSTYIGDPAGFDRPEGEAAATAVDIDFLTGVAEPTPIWIGPDTSRERHAAVARFSAQQNWSVSRAELTPASNNRWRYAMAASLFVALAAGGIFTFAFLSYNAARQETAREESVESGRDLVQDNRREATDAPGKSLGVKEVAGISAPSVMADRASSDSPPNGASFRPLAVGPPVQHPLEFSFDEKLGTARIRARMWQAHQVSNSRDTLEFPAPRGRQPEQFAGLPGFEEPAEEKSDERNLPIDWKQQIFGVLPAASIPNAAEARASFSIGQEYDVRGTIVASFVSTGGNQCRVADITVTGSGEHGQLLLACRSTEQSWAMASVYKLEEIRDPERRALASRETSIGDGTILPSSSEEQFRSELAVNAAKQFFRNSSLSLAEAQAYLEQIYAPEVNYFGRSKLRNEVISDKVVFIERWPEREYEVDPASISVDCDSRGECRVSGNVSWRARSEERKVVSVGAAHFKFTFATAGTLRLVSESSEVLMRRLSPDR